MAEIRGTLAKLTLNGKEIGISSLSIVSADPEEQVVIANPLSSIVGKTFTLKGTFTPSPDFWGVMVGMQLQYNLRELHRNLARLTQWPNTN